MKIKLFLLTTLSLIFCPVCFADVQELPMEQGKIYILSFDDEIDEMLANKEVLDVQILHTIFGDNRQVILSLKNDKETILQVKTKHDLYNYNVKSADKASEELIEIDEPPFENLNVDIYTKDNN